MDLGPPLSLLGLLLVKEAGVPIPVPGDLLVIGAIAASGLAALPLPSFLAGLVVGNGLFVSAHFALGFVIGPPAVAAVSASSGPVLGIVALILLSVVGALGWRWIRARRQAAGEPAAPPSLGPAAWADAACPACVAISLVGGPRS